MNLTFSREWICERSALAGFALASALLIPLECYAGGAAAWVAGVLALAGTGPRVRFRMGILFAAIAALAMAPISTDLSDGHVVALACWFAAVVLGPAVLMHVHERGALEWNLLPRRFQWLDVFYVAIAIPLAWGVIQVYFFVINPWMPTQWPLPAEFDPEARWRLIAGINAVGIWDELFFVNTVYGILRTLFPARLANLAQAVVYTAVLNDMAFAGIGPLVVYAFALTQGAMYERSRCLLYVLIVHVLVDVLLVGAILQAVYPAIGPRWFFT